MRAHPQTAACTDTHTHIRTHTSRGSCENCAPLTVTAHGCVRSCWRVRFDAHYGGGEDDSTTRRWKKGHLLPFSANSIASTRVVVRVCICASYRKHRLFPVLLLTSISTLTVTTFFPSLLFPCLNGTLHKRQSKWCRFTKLDTWKLNHIVIWRGNETGRTVGSSGVWKFGRS